MELNHMIWMTIVDIQERIKIDNITFHVTRQSPYQNQILM